MQRSRTLNTKLKQTVETQSRVIEKCIKRIIELETHIVSIDPNTKIKPFVEMENTSLQLSLKKLFKNPPHIIDLKKIEKITDKYFLSDLESKYDKFIEKNLHLLMLYNLIEDLLDIRDAIILQIGRIKRKERFNEIYS
jgi:hypothetical protein